MLCTSSGFTHRVRILQLRDKDMDADRMCDGFLFNQKGFSAPAHVKSPWNDCLVLVSGSCPGPFCISLHTSPELPEGEKPSNKGAQHLAGQQGNAVLYEKEEGNHSVTELAFWFSTSFVAWMWHHAWEREYCMAFLLEGHFILLSEISTSNWCSRLIPEFQQFLFY